MSSPLRFLCCAFLLASSLPAYATPNACQTFTHGALYRWVPAATRGAQGSWKEETGKGHVALANISSTVSSLVALGRYFRGARVSMLTGVPVHAVTPPSPQPALPEALRALPCPTHTIESGARKGLKCAAEPRWDHVTDVWRKICRYSESPITSDGGASSGATAQDAL